MHRMSFSTANSAINEVVICAAVRTPVGSFRGALSSLSAIQLGSAAVKGALSQCNLTPNHVQELFFGNVISANLGQAPGTQVATGAGLPNTTTCTTVNKVCASGMKSVMMAAQSIALGHQDVVVAGGMESMSNAPYYLDKARAGFGYGHQTVTDSILKDGLWDPKYQIHMGECAEDTAAKFKISRKEQDDHAVSSYKRAAEAVSRGQFKNEIIPVTVSVKGKETIVSEDEEYKKVNFDKLSTLKTVFKKDGTVTAANASTLNDGASAVILTTPAKAKELGLTPLAKILSYADANRDPKEFTIAPSDAIPKALKQCGKTIQDMSLFEINEAFSVVVCANTQILKLDPAKVNVAGGGVSLGHPIGNSGCRILVTLVHLLKSGEFGCASICNGGGGASAMHSFPSSILPTAQTIQMHLYNLPLHKSGAFTHAVVGNFSGRKQQELIACRGADTLEVFQLDTMTGKLHSCLQHQVFGVIRDMKSVRLAGSTRDYLVVGSDSGRLVILEFDHTTNTFKKLHQETYGKSGCRRIVPGQFVACDPKGRALMLAAVEKQKFVYVLNRDSQANLTISSPLEAHKNFGLVFCMVALDVGYENPIFACLEFDYQDADQDSTGETLQKTDKMLTYYELDLGLNHVVRKWSDAVDITANLLVALPGGSEGPSGVIVCHENWITWRNQGYTDVKTRIPRRENPYDDLSRGLIIVTSVVHKMTNSFFVLLQVENGDVFKVTVEHDQDLVKELRIKYFDTLPITLSMSVFKSGFLFAVAEFGDHILYQIEGLADGDDEIEYSSADMELEDDQPWVYYKPRHLKYLAPVDQLESFAPTIDAQVLNLTEDESPQIYTLCGRGAQSSMKIMRTGMEVSELVVYPVPGNPRAVWSIKAKRADEFDSYIIISFQNATLVLSVGESVEEVSDSGFWGETQTITVQQIGEDAMVQVFPTGVRHVLADRKVNEWKVPEDTVVTHASCNNRQVVVALSNNELVYFEMDNMGQLNEYQERCEMSSAVRCLSVGPVPEGRQRSKFLAIGCDDQTVRVASLDPTSCLESLGMQAVNAVPSSLLMVEMMDYGSDKLHPTLYLSIGLENGVLMRSAIDNITGALSDSRSRYLGSRPVMLFPLKLQQKTAVLALSSRPWLSYSHQRRSHLTPLSYETLEYGSSFHSEQCPEAVVAVSENNLRIFSFDKLGIEFTTTTIPLTYTPKRFQLEPFHRNFIVLETDHGVHPDTVTYGDGLDPTAFGYVRHKPGQWVSLIRVLSPLSGETIQRIDLPDNEAAVSLSPCTFHSDPLSTYWIVGTAKDMNLLPRSVTCGFIYVYRLVQGGAFEFIHKTEVEDVPYALCGFQGRLLVGLGRVLRIYDLGKKKVLRKCENKQSLHCIIGLQAQGDRILVSDIQESVFYARYLYQENKILVFADDTRPRYTTKSIMLDYNTAVVGDKFGNVSVIRIPKLISDELDEDKTGNRLLYERPFLQGAPHKLEIVCEFYVGDMITSLHKAVMVAGGRDVIVYTTLMGAVGVLVPFISRENIELFQSIELHMRTEAQPLCGREHLIYRSFYFPVKNVVDGELVEQYNILDADKKRSIAEDLDRTPSEISRQIELMRTRVI